MNRIKRITEMNKNAVSLAALHTHTHTVSLLKKIKRMNI